MTKPHNTELALQLRRLRLAAGFTQQNIADVLGANRSTYTYYETGKTQPDIMTIQKLTVVYQVDMLDMLAGNVDVRSLGRRPKKKIWQDPESIGELSVKEKSLIALLRICDQKELQALIDYLKQLR